MKDEIIVYQADELSTRLEKTTVRKIRTVQIEGGRSISRDLTHYNISSLSVAPPVEAGVVISLRNEKRSG